MAAGGVTNMKRLSILLLTLLSLLSGCVISDSQTSLMSSIDITAGGITTTFGPIFVDDSGITTLSSSLPDGIDSVTVLPRFEKEATITCSVNKQAPIAISTTSTTLIKLERKTNSCVFTIEGQKANNVCTINLTSAFKPPASLKGTMKSNWELSWESYHDERANGAYIIRDTASNGAYDSIAEEILSGTFTPTESLTVFAVDADASSFLDTSSEDATYGLFFYHKDAQGYDISPVSTVSVEEPIDVVITLPEDPSIIVNNGYTLSYRFEPEGTDYTDISLPTSTERNEFDLYLPSELDCISTKALTLNVTGPSDANASWVYYIDGGAEKAYTPGNYRSIGLNLGMSNISIVKKDSEGTVLYHWRIHINNKLVSPTKIYITETQAETYPENNEATFETTPRLHLYWTNRDSRADGFIIKRNGDQSTAYLEKAVLAHAKDPSDTSYGCTFIPIDSNNPESLHSYHDSSVTNFQETTTYTYAICAYKLSADGKSVSLSNVEKITGATHLPKQLGTLSFKPVSFNPVTYGEAATFKWDITYTLGDGNPITLSSINDREFPAYTNYIFNLAKIDIPLNSSNTQTALPLKIKMTFYRMKDTRYEIIGRERTTTLSMEFGGTSRPRITITRDQSDIFGHNATADLTKELAYGDIISNDRSYLDANDSCIEFYFKWK